MKTSKIWKLVVVALCIALALTLAACGGGKSDTGDKEPPASAPAAESPPAAGESAEEQEPSEPAAEPVEEGIVGKWMFVSGDSEFNIINPSGGLKTTGFILYADGTLADISADANGTVTGSPWLTYEDDGSYLKVLVDGNPLGLFGTSSRFAGEYVLDGATLTLVTDDGKTFLFNRG